MWDPPQPKFASIQSKCLINFIWKRSFNHMTFIDKIDHYIQKGKLCNIRRQHPSNFERILYHYIT